MGVNMELDFDKYCKVVRTHKPVPPVPRPHSKRENKNTTEKPCSRIDESDFLCTEEEGFTDIKLRNYRSISCKNLPSGRLVDLEHDKLLRRGSVYQSSRERNSRRAEIGGVGRKKIEFSLGSETSFSFSILDSICGSDEEAEIEPLKQEKDREIDSGKSAKKNSMENQNFKCKQVKERDAFTLHKYLPAKLALPPSPSRSESNSSKKTLISSFTPFKKMFDPITTKSRSHRKISNASQSPGAVSIGRTEKSRKSMAHDFSSVIPNVDSDTHLVNKVQHSGIPSCLPAFLNGNVKMEVNQGFPLFKFSLSHSEYELMAKTWKDENGLHWVYTFHSVQDKSRSYKDAHAPMIGQMQVSRYLRSEKTDGGDLGSSMVAEFVLYDIAHARKGTTVQEKLNCPEAEDFELNDLCNVVKPSMPTNSCVDLSSPYPLAAADLHPSFEIAAIIVQVPFEKRESLKYKRGDMHSNLLDSSLIKQRRKSIFGNNRSLKVNVVTPLGSHGKPIGEESRGASPLIKRWRMGGGCDCGGWDIACPLAVFANLVTRSVKEDLHLEMDPPLRLYIQGGKEDIPALNITSTGKGMYSVNFHAQLSILQTFSICVAILHATEAPSSVEQDKSNECSSLKALVDDEVKVLIEAVTHEERQTVTKTTTEENHASFVINPPFSPIARV